ncbi:type IV secretion protein Rhs [Pseudonocardiaceae bacterium YIM PH 21723]|nr:type IV secretion protein Rhs [Pseudonocardiaceae bacterium YIM PH 21723]
MNNPLVAAPKKEDMGTGFGLYDSAKSMADGMASGDWVEAGLGGVGAAMEVAAAVMDPFGTLAASAVNVLMTHVEPLRKALDSLAGDPGAVKAFGETWERVAKEVSAVAQEYGAEAKSGTGGWTGEAADAYRKHSAEVTDAIAGAGALADGIAAGVTIMGEVVAFVRQMVQEIIAQLIGRLVAWGAELAFTLGLATPIVIAQAVPVISKTIAKVTGLIRKLIGTIRKVLPRIKSLISKLQEIMAKLSKLMGRGKGTDINAAGAKGGPLKRPTDPPTTRGGGDGPDINTAGANGGPPTRGAPETNVGSAGSDGRPGHQGGQKSEGNGGCDGKGGDPVDTVSGQMITNDTDLGLPGLLPLLFDRASASDFTEGGLLGPRWSCTLDQRLEATEDGLRYIGADAEVLVFEGHGDGPRLPLFGARWVLTRDPETDTYLLTDPQIGWTRHFGPARGGTRPITALSDRDGHTITYHRDPVGLPLSIQHSGGYYVAVDVIETAQGDRLGALRVVDQGNAVTVRSYQYDELGRLAAVINSSGLPYQYEYDEHDRITAWIDRNGFSYRYEYRADGRVTRGHSEGGYLNADFDYDLANRVTSVTDSLGHVTRFHYDEHNHITRIVDPLGNATLTEYDRHHRLLAITDPLGRTTRYVYDANGDVIRIERPDGEAIEAEYDQRLRVPTRVSKPGGIEWLRTYTATGSPLTETDPLGTVTTSEYDGRGHLTAGVAVDGTRYEFATNDAGCRLAETSPSGATTRYTLDGFGRPTTLTTQDGAVTQYGWTVEGLPAWKINPDGSREELSYDPEGNALQRWAPNGAVTRFEAGPFYTLVARTFADGSRYTFEYDTELRITRVLNPLGLDWTYEYDPAGRLVRECDFTGREVRYRYDAAGRQIGRAEGDGPELTSEFDVLDQLVLRRVDGEAPVAYEYDAAGFRIRLSDGVTDLRYERDKLGRPLAESIDGRAVRSEFDPLGRRVRRVTPSGVETRWEYSADQLSTAMVGSAGRLDFEFDALGRERGRRLGSQARLTQHYDQLGRLTAQDVWSDRETQPVQSRVFRYRADGALTAIQDRLHGDRAFQVGPDGRVLGVTGANWQERYAYDAMGNLASAMPGADTDAAGPRDLDGPLLRAAGRSSYEYDDLGRLVSQTRRTLSGQRKVWTYTWNGQHQLTGVTTPDGARWSYRYDPLGRRVAKRRLGEDGAVLDETLFSWDGGNLAEQQHTAGARVIALSWDYEDVGAPLAQTRRSWAADAPDAVIDSRFDAIISDLVGTPTELIDADGHVSWSRRANLWGEEFGVRGQRDADCPLRFPGQYHDRETGLHYNLHRYYDPATGRYLTPDPLGLSPSENHYTYVGNPMLETDPFGLMPKRSEYYPTGYKRDTWEDLAKKYTVEGQGNPQFDFSGYKEPKDWKKLNWLDKQGNPITNLTFEHQTAVVDHWNSEGYKQDYPDRVDFYNDTSHMEAMEKSKNSSGGGKMTAKYSDTAPDPNAGYTVKRRC